MERKTCFFIGHRDAPAELLTLILRAVEQHITEYGVSEFIVGHYGRFDALAARAVREKKKQHPDVMLTLLIPYYPIRGWKELSEKYDATFYPPNMESVPKQFAIVRANEYLIRTSNYLICYDSGQIGKTRDFVELARQREKKGLLHIENLADEV